MDRPIADSSIPHQEASYREVAAYGVKWTTLSAIFSLGLQIVRLPILTRLLTPADFGLMAMISVLLGLMYAFIDLGTSNAIIHRRDATLQELSSLYWLNLGVAIVLSTFIIAATPLIATFYAEPRLRALLPWVSPLFLFNAVGFVFRNVMQKQFKFAPLACVEITAVSVGSAAAIIFAIRGCGVLSLIWGQIAAEATTALLSVTLGRQGWHPARHFDIRDLSRYLNFGLYQIGERFINYFSANVDYIVIGRSVGPHGLGSYTLAYQIMVLPMGQINPILSKVAYPLFAKVQSDNAALRNGYLTIAKFLAFTTLPTLTGIALTAPVFVPLIFGSKWFDAIRLIQILALLGILKSFANPTGSILLAKGRVDIGFKWNCLVALLNAITFTTVVRYGVGAVAISHVILVTIYFLPLQAIVCRLIDLPLRQYLVAFVRPSLFVMVMAIVVLFSHNVLTAVIGNHGVLLVSLCLLGALTYLLQVGYFERPYIRDVWRLLINKSPRGTSCLA